MTDTPTHLPGMDKDTEPVEFVGLRVIDVLFLKKPSFHPCLPFWVDNGVNYSCVSMDIY